MITPKRRQLPPLLTLVALAGMLPPAPAPAPGDRRRLRRHEPDCKGPVDGTVCACGDDAP